MNSLTNKEIKDSYKDLLQISNDNLGISNELQSIYDGAGNLSPLKISSTSISIDGELNATDLKISSKSVATQEWVNANVQSVLTNWSETNGHIIPNNNASFDLGNAEYKVRHLFLSDNSIWIGDDFKQEAGVKKKINKTKLPFWFSVNLPSVLDDEIINWYNLEFKDSNLPEATALESLSLSAIIEFAKIKSGNQELSASDVYPSEKKSDGSVNDNYSANDYEYILDDEQSSNVNNFLSNLFESTDNQNKILQVSESGDGITFVETESLRGSQGIQGEQGITGPQGDVGQKGEAGNLGEKGIQGEQGEQGIAGLKGDIGLKGDKGETAPRGIDGDVGEKGEKGIKGLQGDQGADGIDGRSAYEIYTENTSPALSESDWLASLQGNQGVEGVKGEKGNIGDTGPAGAEGADGASVWTTVGSTESDIAYITGNVGIGTTNPDHKLHIAGGTPAMKLEGTQPRIWLSETDQTNLNTLIRNNGSLFQIDTVKDDDSLIANRLTIAHSTGNVGIGKENPEATLHITANDDSENALALWVVNKAHDNSILTAYENGDVQLGGFMYKDNTGNVGIGTTSPNYRLTVTDTNAEGDIAIRVQNNSTTDDTTASLRLAPTTNDTYSTGFITAGRTPSPYMQIGVANSTNAIRIDSNGNVGIGTNSPDNQLHVSGATTIAALSGSNNARLDLVGSNNSQIASIARIESHAGSHNNASSMLTFSTRNNANTIAEKMRIDSNGNVGIGTDVPKTQLHIKSAQPVIRLEDINTNLYSEVSSDSGQGDLFLISDLSGGGTNPMISFRIAGGALANEKMRITSEGNIGIGTTSPNAKLEIAGGGTGVWLKTNNLTNRPSNTMAGQDYINLTNQIPTDENTFEIGPGYINLNRDDHNAINQLSFGMNGALAAAISVGGGNSAADHSLRFKVGRNNDNKAGIERIRIEQNGNVGIGTDAPNAKLDVKSYGSGKIVQQLQTNNTNSFSIMCLGGGGASDVKFSVDGSGDVFVNGNVGIGTPPSSHKLEVKTPGGKYAFSVVDDTQTGIHLGGLYVNNHGSTTDGLDLYLKQPGGNTKVAIVSSGNSYFTGGSVGIGSKTPGSYKLNVQGSVYALNGFTSSDNRVKHNEQSIENALNTLSKITPRKYFKTAKMYEANHDFELNTENKPIDENGNEVDYTIEAGVIAQELKKIDELAFIVNDEIKDDDGNVVAPHAVNYNSLLTYTIAAIQEQQKMIENLTKKVSDLQNQLDTKNTPPAS